MIIKENAFKYLRLSKTCTDAIKKYSVRQSNTRIRLWKALNTLKRDKLTLINNTYPLHTDGKTMFNMAEQV